MINILFSAANVLDASVVAPSALVGEVSSFKITGRGGQAPYSWLVTGPAAAGTLTEILDGPALSVLFIPAEAGTVAFTVRLTDTRRVTKSYRIEVRVLELVAPMGLVLADEDGAFIGVDDPTEGLLLGFDGPAP